MTKHTTTKWRYLLYFLMGVLFGTLAHFEQHPKQIPAWMKFGCKETYINPQGEDTGECE